MRMNLGKAVALLVAVGVLSSCGFRKKYENPITQQTQQPDKILFDKAVGDIEKGRFDVARLEVFGSAARGADFDPSHSDADFLVEFKPGSALPPLEQFFGLADALAKLLGRPVDLVEPSAIKNPFIRAAVDRSRELVYGS